MKMLKIIEEWLVSLKPSRKKPRPATYQDKPIYVHKETETYCIISYTEEAKGLFCVDKKEVT